MDYYQAVGDCFVCGSIDGHDIFCRTLDDIIENISDARIREIVTVGFNEDHRYYGHVVPAEEFIQRVRSGGFNGYDGHIGKIFLNKFTSNLGIIDIDHDLLCGGFPITLEFLEDLSKHYTIEVEWCNN